MGLEKEFGLFSMQVVLKDSKVPTEMDRKTASGHIGTIMGSKQQSIFMIIKHSMAKSWNGILTRNVGIEMAMNANVVKVGGVNVKYIEISDPLRLFSLTTPIMIGDFFMTNSIL